MSSSSDKTDKNSPWDYFTKEKGSGICKISGCGKVIQARGGTTSGLHTHLRTIHNINLLKRKENLEKSTSLDLDVSTNKLKSDLNKGKITNFFRCNIDGTFEAVISRLVALDGLPFLKISQSYDIRKMLMKEFPQKNIPTSHNTVRTLVLDYGDQIRAQVKKELARIRKDNGKFSVTMDEWTSNKSKRFMNVNVHSEDNFWNLGLHRILGSMPAEKAKKIFENCLSSFELSLDDLVGVTSDGASVMKKLGILLNVIHQICLAHGIHLAVLKCLYKKKDDSSQESNDNEEGQMEIETEENEDSCDEAENDIGYELDIELNNIPKDLNFNDDDIRALIFKIRKVVKFFKKSPTQNEELLQKYVREEFNKELALVLDVKTRWNSLLGMLERFYEVRECINKSLVDNTFSAYEFNLMEKIIFALRPIQTAVEALCARDANLISADVSLKFMLDELAKQKTSLSESLSAELINRIRERRSEVSDVLQFLHNPNELFNGDQVYNIFNVTSKQKISKKIEELAVRFFNKESEFSISPEDDGSDIDDPSEEEAFSEEEMSLKDKLQKLISKKFQAGITQEKIETEKPDLKDILKIVKKEVVTFCKTKKRGKYLDLLYKYLLTLKPTSVESERTFSLAGLTCTKIRSNLSDKSLDTIVFLKSYFEKQMK